MYQNRETARELQKVQSFEMDSRTTTKSLAYLNLYFSQKLATGTGDSTLLFAAAEQRWLGYRGRVITSDAPKEEKVRRVNELGTAVRTVRDLESFNAFMVRFGKTQDDSFVSHSAQAVTAHSNADRAATTYIVTFVIGSLLLVFGILDE